MDHSFDPDGLSELVESILRPWTCLRCRLDWLERAFPRTLVHFGWAPSLHSHDWSRGCSERNPSLYQNRSRGTRRRAQAS